MLNCRKSLKILESLETDREKLEFFISGYVTVGSYKTVEDNGLKEIYVPKIRGLVVGDKTLPGGFETPEEAREEGERIMAYWKDELKVLNLQPAS